LTQIIDAIDAIDTTFPILSRGDCSIPNKFDIKINEEYAKPVHLLTEQEYQTLKSSIQTNGLWYPIIINEEGLILDGHHRFKVCEQLNIKPKVEVMSFSTKTAKKLFVINSNRLRRQFNDCQGAN
jgi:ParB-like chromosome segregation protein Spo0J